MAEYAYPYVEPIPSLRVVVVHVLLLLLASISVAGLWRQSRRPATVGGAIGWLVATLLTPIPFVWGMVSLGEHSRPFLVGLLIVTELILATAFLVTTVRLIRREPGVSAVPVGCGLVALIGVSLMLLPAVPSAREAAQRTQCINNLKQLGLGLLAYQSQHGILPSPTTSPSGVAVSWRVELLPYLEWHDLAAAYDKSQPWDAQANHSAAGVAVPIFVCPSNPTPHDLQGRYYTAYAMPVGPQTVFSDESRRRVDYLKASGAAPIGLVEATGRNVVWTQPDDADLEKLPVGINRPGRTPGTSEGMISSLHPGVANVVRLDGSVDTLAEDIDPAVLKQLLTGQ